MARLGAAASARSSGSYTRSVNCRCAQDRNSRTRSASSSPSGEASSALRALLSVCAERPAWRAGDCWHVAVVWVLRACWRGYRARARTSAALLDVLLLNGQEDVGAQLSLQIASAVRLGLTRRILAPRSVFMQAQRARLPTLRRANTPFLSSVCVIICKTGSHPKLIITGQGTGCILCAAQQQQAHLLDVLHPCSTQ